MHISSHDFHAPWCHVTLKYHLSKLQALLLERYQDIISVSELNNIKVARYSNAHK